MQFCKDPMWKLCTGQSVVNNDELFCFLWVRVRVCLLCLTEDMSWMAAETLAEGPTPEARIGHTAIYDPDSRRIFVFGGSKNKKWFNDVHILDTQSWKWTMVEVCWPCLSSTPSTDCVSVSCLHVLHLVPSRLRVRFLLWPTTAAACLGVNSSCWEECSRVPTRSLTAVVTHCTSSIPTSPSGTSP